ncbi:extracellular solute-binding protein [Pullulanibacillus sp. KACC 23026]|uniref:ABC transporter substrate-binding protein n=1 Tax=Pullulanibacillus sp. KACC 23026 TaxID=3028315 RepID=UPI0023B1F4F6|nr:extracellular solute-binding protein [Pullulanibacillus sp. KACC 23026]WEG13491.1 extracellular solute-binding protein [Pullulanibacillus sp. KACC 23026]
MKKWHLAIVMMLALSLFLTGCSSSKSTSSGGGNGKVVTLSLYSTMSSDESKTMDKVIADFEKANPNIKINANYPGDNYENLLRVKMAANKMPDLFDTHGWAQLRYGNYVEDLRNMSWVKNMDPAIKDILTDKNGKVYAYPINEAKDGVTYNATLLKKYGITPPTTLNDFVKALETIKQKSHGTVTPLWIAGGDKYPIGQIFDQMATPYLITDSNHSYGQQLLDGTFNWNKYTPVAQMLKNLQNKGLINQDALTAKSTQANQLMAQGKIGFAFINGSIGPEATKLNPNTKVGLIPTPAVYSTDQPSFIGGERYTFAVWKDSPYKKQAEKFIEFISQPKYAKELAEATSLPAGLTNVKAKNYYASYYKEFSNIKVQPYFDRVYLPSGMWDVMGNTGQQLLSGTMTASQVATKMGQEDARLKKQTSK